MPRGTVAVPLFSLIWSAAAWAFTPARATSAARGTEGNSAGR